jgi:hypothetical protein
MDPSLFMARRAAVAEEFAAHVCRIFFADAPLADAEAVVGAFRGALLAEAADQCKPLHGLPRAAMGGVVRRFVGGIAFEREVADVLGGAYGTAQCASPRPCTRATMPALPSRPASSHAPRARSAAGW